MCIWNKKIENKRYLTRSNMYFYLYISCLIFFYLLSISQGPIYAKWFSWTKNYVDIFILFSHFFFFASFGLFNFLNYFIDRLFLWIETTHLHFHILPNSSTSIINIGSMKAKYERNFCVLFNFLTVLSIVFFRMLF